MEAIFIDVSNRMHDRPIRSAQFLAPPTISALTIRYKNLQDSHIRRWKEGGACYRFGALTVYINCIKNATI